MNDSELEFNVADRVRSFWHAGKGISFMLRYEYNAWVHMLATFVVCAVGLYFGLNKYEWCIIVLAIVSVWTAEALNTALEFLCDVASPGFHPLIEKSKDVAAGAVLVCSLGSVIVAILIFGPYVKGLFQ